MAYKLDPFQRIIHFHYSIVPDFITRNEGETVTFNVTTPNIPNGSILYWNFISVSGSLTNGDFTSPANATSGGTVVINNRQGTIPFVVNEDVLLEGPESFKLELRTDSHAGQLRATSAVVTIVDTSYPGSTPEPGATLVSSAFISGASSGGGQTVDRYINDIMWHPSGSCVAVAHSPLSTGHSVTVYNKIGTSLVVAARLKIGTCWSVDWSSDGTKLLTTGGPNHGQSAIDDYGAIIYNKSNYSIYARSDTSSVALGRSRFLSGVNFVEAGPDDASSYTWSVSNGIIQLVSSTAAIRPPMLNVNSMEVSSLGVSITLSDYKPWDGTTDYTPQGGILKKNSGFVQDLPIDGLRFNWGRWNKQGTMFAVAAAGGGTSTGLGGCYTGLLVYSVSGSNFTRLPNPTETGPDYFSNANLAAGQDPFPLGSFHFNNSYHISWNPQGTKLAISGVFVNYPDNSTTTLKGIIIYSVSGGSLSLLNVYMFPIVSTGTENDYYKFIDWDPSGSYIAVGNNKYLNGTTDPQVLLYQVN